MSMKVGDVLQVNLMLQVVRGTLLQAMPLPGEQDSCEDRFPKSRMGYETYGYGEL